MPKVKRQNKKPLPCGQDGESGKPNYATAIIAGKETECQQLSKETPSATAD